jgi:hypothetical protein
MKILKALKTQPNSQIFQISNLKYIVTEKPNLEILQGGDMINPIEVIEHTTVPEKRHSVYKGAEMILAAIKLGYTHIEGVVVNDFVLGKEYKGK